MMLVKDSMASSGKFVSGIKQLLIYHNYFYRHLVLLNKIFDIESLLAL